MNARLESLEQQVLELLTGRHRGARSSTLGALAEQYRAAGITAITQSLPEVQWHYLRIDTPDFGSQNDVLAGPLGRTLELLETQGTIASYWFMRKADEGAHLRLRCYGHTRVWNETARPHLEETLRAERDRGLVTKWGSLVYEPESALFGGLKGMDLAHRHFSIDSRFIVRWQQAVGSAARPGLLEASIYGLNLLYQAAALDSFEIWDTWLKVRNLRFIPDGELDAAFLRNQETLRILLELSENRFLDELPLPGRSAAAEYLEGLHNLGAYYQHVHRSGELQRGLRAVLSCLTIFHWNRIGLPGGVQAGVAYMMVRTTAPKD